MAAIVTAWRKKVVLSMCLVKLADKYQVAVAKERRRQKRLWATICIGRRFRKLTYRNFNNEQGLKEYIEMRKKESKEKAKAAMRANQGKAVKEDFDEESFKWE